MKQIILLGAEKMSTFELAEKAKREKKFDLALDYHQQIINDKGISVNLLQEVANIFYLKGVNDHAVAFNLAAAHLSLHVYQESYKQGDEAIKNALENFPKDLLEKFPEPIGALLTSERDTMRHLSHALMDQELIFEKAPAYRPFAEVYYAQLLDDGSEKDILKKLKITNQDVLAFDRKHYFNHGFQILLGEIKWDQLDNPNVYQLYINPS